MLPEELSQSQALAATPDAPKPCNPAHLSQKKKHSRTPCSPRSSASRRRAQPLLMPQNPITLRISAKKKKTFQDAVLPEELSQSQARAATPDAPKPYNPAHLSQKKNIPGRRAPRGAQPVAGARSHS